MIFPFLIFLQLSPFITRNVISLIASLLYFSLPGYLLCKILNIKYDRFEILPLSIATSTFLVIFSMEVCGILSLVVYTPLMIIFMEISLFILCKWRKIELFNYKLNASILPTMLVLIIFYIAIVSLRNNDFLRFPDEYVYLAWGKEIVGKNNIFALNTISGRVGIMWEASPHEFLRVEDFTKTTMFHHFHVVVYTFFWLVNGFGFYQATFLSALFYVSLGMIAYLFGQLENDSVGLIAAIFLLTNPAIWIFANRVLPDILSTFLGTLSLYLVYKSKNDELYHNYGIFLPLIFLLISLFVTPTVIFLPIAVMFYMCVNIAFNRKVSLNIKIYSLIPLIFFTAWLVRDILLLFKGYPINPIYNAVYRVIKPLSFSLEEWRHYLFSNPTGAYGTWLYPWFYTHAIFLLAFDGFLIQSTEKKRFLPALVVLVYLWVGGTIITEVRRMFPIFPLLMSYAATSCFENRQTSILLPLVYLFTLLVPLSGYVPYFQGSYENYITVDVAAFSIMVGFIILLFKLFKVLNFRIYTSSGNFKRWRITLYSKYAKNNVETIFLITLLCTSTALYYGFYINKNGPSWVNESNSVWDLGLPQALDWTSKNVPHGAKIMTNYVFEIPAILGIRYRYIEPPGTYRYPSENLTRIFLSNISNVDYILVFADAWEDWYPYFKSFMNVPPPGFEEAFNTTNSLGNKVLVIFRRTHASMLTLTNGSWNAISPENSDAILIKGSLLIYNVSNVSGSRKLVFNPVSAFNMSHSKYLAFWIYSYSKTTISIEISSPPTIEARYAWYRTLSQGWNLVILPLEKPDAKEVELKKIDLNNINEIRIYPNPKDKLVIDVSEGFITW